MTTQSTTYRPSIVPSDASTVITDAGIAYLFNANGKSYAVGVRTKAKRNHEFFYSFRTEDQRTKYVNNWIDGLLAHQEAVTKRKAERVNFKHTLKVGDVLMAMWGYDQTNVDYYEVTALIGSKQVEIRQIASQSEPTLYMQGVSVPKTGAYIGEPMRKIVKEGNRVKIESYCHASPLPFTEVAGVRCYKQTNWTAYA